MAAPVVDTSAATTSGLTSGANSFAFNNAAGDLMLVGFFTNGTGDVLTASTYNGVAMTLLGKNSPNGTDSFTYLYSLRAPATGSHNVVATISSGAVDARPVSISGTNQSAFPDASSSNTFSAATSVTGTVTPTAGATTPIVVMFAASNRQFTASTGATAISTADQMQFFKNSGAVTAGSPYSETVTMSSAQGGYFIVSIASPASSIPNKIVQVKQAMTRASTY
jgi:hypothetical protein